MTKPSKKVTPYRVGQRVQIIRDCAKLAEFSIGYSHEATARLAGSLVTISGVSIGSWPPCKGVYLYEVTDGPDGVFYNWSYRHSDLQPIRPEVVYL